MCSVLVLEWVEGSTLEALHHRGAIPPLLAVEIARQLCEICVHLAASKFAHCDLQPKNVFVCVTNDGVEVRLIDFGEAANVDQAQDRPAGRRGAPPFQSAEMLKHVVPLSPATDMFALALLFWHCLAGRPVWEEAVRRLEKQRGKEEGWPEGMGMSLAEQQEAIAREKLRPPLDLLPGPGNLAEGFLPPASLEALRELLVSMWEEEAESDERMIPEEAADLLGKMQICTPGQLRDLLERVLAALPLASVCRFREGSAPLSEYSGSASESKLRTSRSQGSAPPSKCSGSASTPVGFLADMQGGPADSFWDD
uniref:Protein kinase domain-containing protein n=1 Tax=Chromera velia CCMP2878 TaxID=1169474 RepID=A0A0G4HI43_9ALVE|eukprot:Cvel_1055.t1-p1 / transcript=Cvel_1055.t1 / gene=Cvel_1055 / organism=Chromera_velia_CCMP2878 / gene_product=Probable myosin light chain kinase DDB_G0282429, putative / transcript_product=Probable myosin light chain kinase DDB_G0282429, putative / location=Cvel_scaffold34:94923-96379(+) / protein_length=309 / sequence_SO=supercontig / SO=protein_coding / is_pseudo=false